MTEKICPICENLFKPHSNNQKFCSKICSKKNRKLYMRQWNEDHIEHVRNYAASPKRRKRRKEIAALPENKQKRAVYGKMYKQLPYVKENEKKYAKKPKAIRKRNELKARKVKKAKELLGGKCDACETTKDLQFHHLVYENKTGNEHNNELEVIKHPERFCLLCRKCHNVVTFLLTDTKRTMLVLKNNERYARKNL